MIAVAAATCPAWVSVNHRRSVRYLELAIEYREQEETNRRLADGPAAVCGNAPRLSAVTWKEIRDEWRRRADHYDSLRKTYQYAARYPWLPVAPDPPAPERKAEWVRSVGSLLPGRSVFERARHGTRNVTLRAMTTRNCVLALAIAGWLCACEQVRLRWLGFAEDYVSESTTHAKAAAACRSLARDNELPAHTRREAARWELHYQRLADKYRYVAENPWFFVLSDPPTPVIGANSK
jgi:hypothetical protein